jgi:hypothetical protein
MRYSFRIASVSFVVAVLTLALVASVPHTGEVRVLHPLTDAQVTVRPTAPIVMPFSRPVDRRSAEQAFVIYPPVKGRLRWQGHTMIFQPLVAMQPHTTYRVTLKAGLRDIWGRANDGPIQWVLFTD